MEAGDTHIYPTDLTLLPGKFNNLLGATLAGKTTLMRLMAGLELPTAGSVFIDGQDVTGQSVRERDVAMVYQQFVNYPTMSVFDNIASPLCARGRPPPDLHKRVGEVAELMRISDLLHRMPQELSGGQQQRTAIARALVRHAKLVLLDEPLANLDYKLREELREELPQLFAERGSVIVYATTEPSEALMMGGNTALLYEGQVVQFGPASEVYHNPQTLLSARIFSYPPLNEMIIESYDGKAMAETAGITVPLHGPLEKVGSGRYHIGFRPHHLKLGLAPSDVECLSFQGAVTLAEIPGSESFVHVRVGSCDWVLQTHQVVRYTDNETIHMHISIDNLMVFEESGNRLEAAA